MRSFNCSSKMIATWLSLTALVGCTIPNTQSREENDSAASYVITTTKAEVTQTKMIEGFSIPTSKTFHFVVCLQDKQRGKPINNHDFSVKGAAVALDLTTDGDGCLNWDEEITYNHFDDAHPVPMDRELHPHGFHKGLRTVHWGLNPWQDQVLDLDKNAMKGLVDKSKVEETLHSYDLRDKVIVLSEIHLTSELKTNSGKATAYRFDFNGQPGFESKNISSEVKFNLVNQGTFKWRAHLIHSFAGKTTEKREVLFSTEFQQATMSHGSLAAQFEQVLPGTCSNGSYYLGVEMESILPAPYKLGKFNGVYLITADCSKLDGNFVLKPTSEALSDKDFSVKKFIEAQISLNGAGRAQKSQLELEGTRDAGFEATEINPPRVIDYKGSNGNVRRTHLALEMSIRNKINGNPVNTYKYSLTKTDGSKVSGTTKSDGSLNWDESFSYNFEQHECQTQKEVTIEIPDLNFSEKIPLLINPWHDQVVDLHYNKELNKDINGQNGICADGDLGLTASSVTFTKSAFKYDVDEYLNLVVKKVVNLNLWLTSIVRPTLLADPSGSEVTSLPLGDYQLQLALLVQDADPLHLNIDDIVWYKKLDQPTTVTRQGLPRESVEFAIEDLKNLNSTLKLLILIEPVDSNNQIRPVVEWGNINFSNESEFPALVALDSINGAQLMGQIRQYNEGREAQRKQKFAPLSTKEAFSQKMSLSVINLDQDSSWQGFLARTAQIAKVSAKTSMTKEQLGLAVINGADKNFAGILTQYWFQYFLRTPWTDQNLPILDPQKNQAIAAITGDLTGKALSDPRSVFDIQQRAFVERPAVTHYREGSQYTLGIKQGVAAEMANVRSEETTTSQTNGAGLGFDFGLKIEASGSNTNSAGKGSRWASENATAAGASIELQVDQKVLNLHADSAERCLVFKLKPEVVSASQLLDVLNPKLTPVQKKQAAKLGVMFCEGSSHRQPLDFVESYYMVNQHLSQSSLMDIAAQSNRLLFAAVRGDSDMAAFLSSVTGSVSMPPEFSTQYLNKNFMKERTTGLFRQNLPAAPGQVILNP